METYGYIELDVSKIDIARSPNLSQLSVHTFQYLYEDEVAIRKQTNRK